MLGLKPGVIKVCEREEAWELDAQNTIFRLKDILTDVVKDIQHVGSTSIPSIKARPIIDIAIAVDNFAEILAYENELRENGLYYCQNTQTTVKKQLLFACGSYYDGTGDLQTHSIYVVYAGSKDWLNYINFRNYLKEKLMLAKEYEALKERCTLLSIEDNAQERYLIEKHNFIVSTLRRALTASYLGKMVRIKIDRPLGSRHPRFADLVYPVNYGYIPGVWSEDGEALDGIFVGNRGSS